jgi:hypothetical protein
LLADQCFRIIEDERGIAEKELEQGKGRIVIRSVLFCYASEDQRMASLLKNHLGQLKHNELITIWDQGEISPGDEWKQTMNAYLQEAQIILLLMSSSFLASDYCYSMQMQEAIRRHEQQTARVIPIILRSVHWQGPPLDKLKVLPDEQKPISEWRPQDKGYANVVMNIAQVVKQWNEQNFPGPTIERKAMMLTLDQLIEKVKGQLQPEPRALATASTLQQLSIFIPTDVTLAGSGGRMAYSLSIVSDGGRHCSYTAAHDLWRAGCTCLSAYYQSRGCSAGNQDLAGMVYRF